MDELKIYFCGGKDKESKQASKYCKTEKRLGRLSGGGSGSEQAAKK
jgi:hypothetical protein